jgi:hypothetical protein
LFNRAGLRIYSYVVNPTGLSGRIMENGVYEPRLTFDDLMYLNKKERWERLLEAVLTEAKHFTHSRSLKTNGVKDNQSLTFDESGLVLYQSKYIPDTLNMQLWVIESNKDVRKFALDAETVLESEVFKSLLEAVCTALAATDPILPDPILSGVIDVGGVVANLLKQQLKANKDDLVGYWQCTLNREEHYPHGTRDRQDVPDSTGNIRVDYTLFGFEKTV